MISRVSEIPFQIFSIVSIAWLGVIYKNATLPEHDIPLTDSLRIAVLVMPTVADGPASGDVTAFVNADTDGKVTFILTPGGTTYLYNVIEGEYYNPDYVPILTLEGTFAP